MYKVQVSSFDWNLRGLLYYFIIIIIVIIIIISTPPRAARSAALACMFRLHMRNYENNRIISHISASEKPAPSLLIHFLLLSSEDSPLETGYGSSLRRSNTGERPLFWKKIFFGIFFFFKYFFLKYFLFLNFFFFKIFFF